ncbi:glycoside hydrolase family 5 protein [Laccaria amethystina LaAM-08-1]|uniref:Glycoside hydrolase family 5 protein n=1 Tax=Laccaria amethystina LaAM-08-1 TaxID=1095629 RepID=A0A0C9WKF1_9AGAR|nr:glycoside hydrolase family 5 protein [Laccaria amethystina LaAM-08-1]
MPTQKTSTTLLDTYKRKAWRSDGPTSGRCFWELHHVSGWDNVQENYFNKNSVTGKKVDWYTDFYYPL